MCTKIIFNAQLYNTGRRIKAISGRVGNFIFRTYKDGKMNVFYSPKYKPLSSRYRVNFESLSNQLREITDDLALVIIAINYQELQ